MSRSHATPPPTQAQQQRAKRESKHWIEYATLLFIVITAAAAFTAAYYTRQQWKTANETMIFAERAFIHNELPALNVGRNADGPDYIVAININLRNSGNTPPRALEFLVKCVTSVTDLVEPWGLLHQGTIAHIPQIIGPKSSVPTMCTFTQDQIKQMGAKKLFGYVLGDIGYFDIFEPKPHITQFSIKADVIYFEEFNRKPVQSSPAIPESTPPVGSISTTAPPPSDFTVSMGFRPVGRHNCADDDCPK